jgi:hypothetical protein
MYTRKVEITKNQHGLGPGLFWPQRTKIFLLSSRAVAGIFVGRVNCCWPLPAQYISGSETIGTHGNVYVLPRLLHASTWSLVFDERSGLNILFTPLLSRRG